MLRLGYTVIFVPDVRKTVAFYEAAFGLRLRYLNPTSQYNAIAQAVAAGAVLVTSADAKPWGQTLAYLRDLNGVLIELCTPAIR